MTGLPGQPGTPPGPAPAPAPTPGGRRQVLGCLAVVVVLGLLFIVWLGWWGTHHRLEERAERARLHLLRREAEERLRGRVPAGDEGERRPGTASPEEARAAAVIAGRMRELSAAGDWAGVIQCAGLLEDLQAGDPALDLMLEKALFNRALDLLRGTQPLPALECLEELLGRRPDDREAADLRSIAMTIRESGPDRRTAEALERYAERR